MVINHINHWVFVLLLVGAGACSSKSSETEIKEMSSVDTLYKSQPFTSNSEFTGGIEGPAVDKNGVLYVVNFEKQGTIGKVTPDGKASLFVNLPEGSTGNGIRFNSKGEMLIADYTGHNVLKVDMESLAISVYAHHDELNQPNDIAIMDNDIVFASDPDWKNSKGQIWRVGLDGKFVLLETDMGTTNGIEVSPDNKTLYVNESVQRTVWAYDLNEEGEISNKRLIHTFEDFGMDGMRVDTDGDLYVTRHGKGTVAKLSPKGDLLEEIKMTGEKPSNIAFGGSDGRTAYVTLQDNGNIDTFLVEKPGREFVK
ncbi:SMP-30/gluconolactonase/LRE family protein [Cyclobacterium qasimii]|uniref:Gluconolactonase n=2 Tax=Cyclobacterium qasimii TaxID=1350429 RepID=S7V8E9_9BACT|nr:SMP-30/gluconolactonase/LRE family protein [Cyclobacterium qasimii]EPR65847.1 Gluconolactonase [Cyclobacterium qasimii M12-11B]GEO23282.1 gluconolactonase [Cyclobacterium qasimii]